MKCIQDGMKCISGGMNDIEKNDSAAEYIA